MRILIAFLFLAGAVIACGNSTDANSLRSKASVSVNGKQIYQTYCVACHGLNGRMQLNGAKDFTKSTLPVEERIEVITNGRNLMTPFKELLNKKEIEAVAKYTLKLSKQK